MSVITISPKDLATPTKLALEENRQISTSKAPVQTPEATEAAKPDELNSKFAILAKKEKALRDKERAISTEREAMRQAKLQADAEKAAHLATLKARMPQDPQSVLSELGLSPEQLTQYLLNQPKPEDARFLALEQKYQELLDKQTKASEQAVEAQNNQYEQAKRQIRSEVTLLVDGNEEFETIKSMNAEDAVVELIEETFKKDNVLMDVSEAAKEVEEYLLERALTIARLKKVQSKLTPAQAVAQEKQQQTEPKQQATLSNRIVQSTAKPRTERDRVERAKLAFQGLLTD